MTRRIIASSLLCVSPLSVAASAQTVAERAASPIAVRVVRTIPVEGPLFTLFKGPLRCDPDGNLFLVPLSVSTEGRGLKITDTVVRISADGKKTTRATVATGLGVPNMVTAGVTKLALDPNGNLYVLADVGTSDTRAGRQYIVAFDSKGEYKAKVEIDPEEVIADDFAVFGSGDFLLWGRPARRTRFRVAVMPAGGGRLRDVELPNDASDEEGPWLDPSASPPRIAAAEPATDGRVYFAQSVTDDAVYAVSRFGEVTGRLQLEPPRREATLYSLKVSDGRLAAIYHEQGSHARSASRWIVVHDLSTGEAVASYGPVQNSVMCYQALEGLKDRFIALGVEKGRMRFLTLATH